MIVRASFDEAWLGLLSDLHRQKPTSSRLGLVKELIGWSMRLTDPDATVLTNRRRRASAPFWAAELLWILSGTDDVSLLLHYCPQYLQYCEPGTSKTTGAYGYRLKQHDSLTRALDLLSKEPDTRRCVVPLYWASDLDSDARDVPCTVSWQFIRRDGMLHMVCSMRSNDAWVGHVYDVMVNCAIQRMLAWTLGDRPGEYVHQAGSIHLYEKDWDKAKEALHAGHMMHTPTTSWPNKWACNLKDLDRDAEIALRAERVFRLEKGRAPLPRNPVLQDAALCVGTKHVPAAPELLMNARLRFLLEEGRAKQC